MKSKITFLAWLSIVVAVAAPAEAALTFLADLGTEAGEAGYAPADWGPIEPTTHPGGWGGIAGDPASYDKRCRTVWGCIENTKAASIAFPTPIVSAAIRHLDGGSDDSFIVEVDGSLWGSYSAIPGVGDFWIVNSFSGVPGTTLTITCTAAAGPYWNPYGQVGIDRIEAEPIPEPGTILLVGLGGLCRLSRRRP
ncbi:MAG TPA: PEP-CTERM sorting domain-containing protein [Sedimentisphaerales bacterium]|nr:PEP-CTERM sorting domain-containing protein [Sedimentisphaerales bacterium]